MNRLVSGLWVRYGGVGRRRHRSAYRPGATADRSSGERRTDSREFSSGASTFLMCGNVDRAGSGRRSFRGSSARLCGVYRPGAAGGGGRAARGLSDQRVLAERGRGVLAGDVRERLCLQSLRYDTNHRDTWTLGLEGGGHRGLDLDLDLGILYLCMRYVDVDAVLKRALANMSMSNCHCAICMWRSVELGLGWTSLLVCSFLRV